MTTTVTINGQNFEYPVTGDTGWGGPATAWAQAVSLHLLQKTGGTFTLSADVDFGASFGLISPYYKSSTTPRAGVGTLRLANTDDIAWRNFANSADLLLSVGTDNLIEFGGVDLALVTQLVTTFVGLTDTPGTITPLQFLRGNAGGTALEFAAVGVNTQVLNNAVSTPATGLDFVGVDNNASTTSGAPWRAVDSSGESQIMYNGPVITIATGGGTAHPGKEWDNSGDFEGTTEQVFIDALAYLVGAGIASGATILVKPGTYTITTGDNLGTHITSTIDNVKILGSGKDTIIQRAGVTSPGASTQNFFISITHDNWTLENLTLRGDGFGSGSESFDSTISVTGDGFKIKDCLFTNWAQNRLISISGSDHVVECNTFTTPATTALQTPIFLSGTLANIVIRDNFCDDWFTFINSSGTTPVVSDRLFVYNNAAIGGATASGAFLDFNSSGAVTQSNWDIHNNIAITGSTNTNARPLDINLGGTTQTLEDIFIHGNHFESAGLNIEAMILTLNASTSSTIKNIDIVDNLFVSASSNIAVTFTLQNGTNDLDNLTIANNIFNASGGSTDLGNAVDFINTSAAAGGTWTNVSIDGNNCESLRGFFLFLGSSVSAAWNIDTWSISNNIINQTSTARSPITFQWDHETASTVESLKIANNNIINNGTNAILLEELSNASLANLTVNNLDISNNTIDSLVTASAAIQINSARVAGTGLFENISISNNIINGGQGINLNDSANTTYGNVILEGNSIDLFFTSAMLGMNLDVDDGCLIANNQIDIRKNTAAALTCRGITLPVANDVVISGNLIRLSTNATESASDDFAGILTAEASGTGLAITGNRIEIDCDAVTASTMRGIRQSAATFTNVTNVGNAISFTNDKGAATGTQEGYVFGGTSVGVTGANSVVNAGDGNTAGGLRTTFADP